MKSKSTLHKIGLTLLMVLSFQLYTSAQSVTKTFNASGTISVDGVGDYGTAVNTFTFNTSDFTSGCMVTDVNVSVTFAKTDGTCASPGTGNSFHAETSFRLDGPDGTQVILAQPSTWTGSATMTLQTVGFDQSAGTVAGGATPTSGTFRPNGGDLNTFNGISGLGDWTFRAGDSSGGDELCITSVAITVITATDNMNPTASCTPYTVLLDNTGNATITAANVDGGSSDLCGIASMSVSPNTFDCTDVGPNNVTLTLTDTYGNVSSCMTTVTVEGASASNTIATSTACSSPCVLADGDEGTFISNGGGYIGTITDASGSGALGSTTICVDVSGSAQGCANTYHLGRKWTVTVGGTNGPATVKLYLTSAELNSLATSSGYTDAADLMMNGNLGVTTSDLSTCPENGNNNWYPSPTIMANDPAAGIYSLEVAVSGFSTIFLHPATANGPLPVELLSFTGRKSGDVHILDWSTATEENSAYFEVERSVNGEDFEYIGRLNAAGFSVEEQSYSFVDNRPESGVNYYRLRMVDLDGTFEYSGIVAIKDEISLTDVKVMPNPFSNVINIELNTVVSGETKLELMDMSGRLVKSETFLVEEGYTLKTIDSNQLENGIYIARVFSPDGGTKVFKLFKQ